MELNGLLLIDKPADHTSHDVVRLVRRALRQKSVGHTGTLDPLATGLMVMVLGEATKISDYLVFSDKSYRLTARLGLKTDTLDRTGKVLSERLVDVPMEKIEAEVRDLKGDFDWPVPVFSAAKVDGKKLYEYGRAGEAIETPIKRMSFSDLRLESIEPDRVRLSLECSKGSFVRSWCDQLGDRLGTGGVLEELRRLTVGPYSVEDAITLEDLEVLANQETLQDHRAFVPLAHTLPHWKLVRVPAKEERLLKNGQIPKDLANRLIIEQKEALRLSEPIGIKVVGFSGSLVSLLVAQPGQGLKIRRVFRLDRAPSTH